MDNLRIGLIGYGEVGRIFSAGFKPGAAWSGAWDLKFADPAQRDEPLAHAAAQGIEACDGVASLCARSTLVISAVTASNTLAVAQAAAAHIRPGSFFLDLNSASPGTNAPATAWSMIMFSSLYGGMPSGIGRPGLFTPVLTASPWS